MKHPVSADLLGGGRSLPPYQSCSTRFVAAWQYALKDVVPSNIHCLSGQPTFFQGWPLISLYLTIHLYPVFNSLMCTSLSFTFHLPTTYPFNYMMHWPITNNPRLCIIIFIDCSRVYIRFRLPCKASATLPAPRSGYAATIMVFFAHLLI